MPTTTITASADTYLDETGASPSGGEGVVHCGWTGGDGFQNPLFKFSLSGVGGIVTDAKIQLYLQAVSTEPGTRSGYWGVIKNSTAWVEAEADWDEYATGQNWATAGLDPDDDFEVYPDASFTLPQTTATIYQYTITSLVQYAVANGFSDVTIAAYNQDGGILQQTDCSFAARTSIFDARRPKLIVTTIPGGLINLAGNLRKLAGGIGG